MGIENAELSLIGTPNVYSIWLGWTPFREHLTVPNGLAPIKVKLSIRKVEAELANVA